MAGIYIHIPFCKQACHYCNFHFSTSLRMRDAFVSAICSEINSYKPAEPSEDIETVYFGGGTPSLLTAEELSKIFDAIHEVYTVRNSAEITLEANPDDISVGKLKTFQRLGVNRLSIGIQSFFDADLEFMNRAHDASEATSCIEMALAAGIDDINIDLIYGTPTLTDEMWKANLLKVSELGLPHLSAYQLTVEPRTALASFIEKGKIPPLPESKAVRQFDMLMDWAEDKGYDHYEISNLSLPGRHSRHNSSYWKGEPYIGFGPSSHSFNAGVRSWNIANNALYIKAINGGESPVLGREQLTDKDKYNEYVMTGLRLSHGVDLDIIIAFGPHYKDTFINGIRDHIANEMVEKIDNKYRLTRSGKIYADRIASDCFLV